MCLLVLLCICSRCVLVKLHFQKYRRNDDCIGEYKTKSLASPCHLQQYFQFSRSGAFFSLELIQLIHKSRQKNTYHLPFSTTSMERKGNSVRSWVDKNAKGPKKRSESEILDRSHSATISVLELSVGGRYWEKRLLILGYRSVNAQELNDMICTLDIFRQMSESTRWIQQNAKTDFTDSSKEQRKWGLKVARRPVAPAAFITVAQ